MCGKLFRWKGSDALLARPCSKGRASERRRTGRERRRKLTETWRVPRVRHDIELELVNHRVHLEVLDCRLVAARARPGLNEPPVRTVRDVIEVDNVLPYSSSKTNPGLGEFSFSALALEKAQLRRSTAVVTPRVRAKEPLISRAILTRAAGVVRLPPQDPRTRLLSSPAWTADAFPLGYGATLGVC